MIAVARRGENAFVVKHEGRFYLVDMDQEEAFDADPPDDLTIFIKAGMWEDVTRVDSATQTELERHHEQRQP
jgi:hypothetical protein